MKRKLRFRRGWRPPPLCEEQILAWADTCHARTGNWPKKESGPIDGTFGEKWVNVDMALRIGLRGLPGGSSLARLLAKERGVRNHLGLPRLTRKQILVWADAYFRRTGTWPSKLSGPIEGTNGETWLGVNVALVAGNRGLPSGSSLPQLLCAERGVRNLGDVLRLTVKIILAWADAHYKRTGEWPHTTTGPIVDAPGETWAAVQTALNKGQRGLPGGDSLARLLAKHRGARNRMAVPPLTVKQILAWADAYFRVHGRWPKRHDGPVEGSNGETWDAVATALEVGIRGLPGGSSLPKLLAEHRGVRNLQGLPRLTAAQILVWADAFVRKTGKWPNRDSGPIEGSGGETWSGVDAALKAGKRGLPGGSSLVRLLIECRG